jgi:hypothetical protein
MNLEGLESFEVIVVNPEKYSGTFTVEDVFKYIKESLGAGYDPSSECIIYDVSAENAWVRYEGDALNFNAHAKNAENIGKEMAIYAKILTMPCECYTLNDQEDIVERFTIDATGNYLRNSWRGVDIPEDVLAMFGKDGWYEGHE